MIDGWVVGGIVVVVVDGFVLDALFVLAWLVLAGVEPD